MCVFCLCVFVLQAGAGLDRMLFVIDRNRDLFVASLQNTTLVKLGSVTDRYCTGLCVGCCSLCCLFHRVLIRMVCPFAILTRVYRSPL